jgi:hypothetical protein
MKRAVIISALHTLINFFKKKIYKNCIRNIIIILYYTQQTVTAL